MIEEDQVKTKSGAILLSRSLMESCVFQDENLLKVWIWCLLKASHKDNFFPMRTGRGSTIVNVKRGQFVFGRKQAAKELRMKPSSVQDRMKKLQNLQNLDIQSNTHYSIVTICNYDYYQNLENYKGQATRQPTVNQPSTNRQPTVTYNNVNNVKNEENKEKTFHPNSDELRLSELLWTLILKRNPNHKKPNLQNWAKHISLMIRVDKRITGEIEKIIRWCQDDLFWQNNILSTDKLRKQYDQLKLKMEAPDKDEINFDFLKEENNDK